MRASINTTQWDVAMTNANISTAINLMQGDCLELMKTIPDGSVDLILTDPPYGTTACKWDSVIDFDLMWAELKRIIKPNLFKQLPLQMLTI